MIYAVHINIFHRLVNQENAYCFYVHSAYHTNILYVLMSMSAFNKNRITYNDKHDQVKKRKSVVDYEIVPLASDSKCHASFS